jgi:hypothetical protein
MSVCGFSEHAKLKYVILFMDCKVQIIYGDIILQTNCENMQIKILKYFPEDARISSTINLKHF